MIKIFIIHLLLFVFMLGITYLRMVGIFLDYKEEHPNVKFKPISIPTLWVNIIKMLLIFFIPIINITAFIILVFVVTTEEIEEQIEEKTYLD